MDTTLHLQFTCTPEELDEASRLATEFSGSASAKWRSRFLLLAIYGLMLYGLDLDFRRSFEPSTRIGLLAGVAALFVSLPWILRRLKRRGPSSPTRLGMSATGVTIEKDGARISALWSVFERPIETPLLFLLVDRSRETLVVIPKRALPDAQAAVWLRAVGKEPGGSSATPAESTPASVPAPPGSIAVSFRLGFPDFLNRSFASWRTRSVLLIVFFALGFTALIEWILSARGAGIGLGRVVWASLPLFGFVVTMIVLVALISWRSERRRHGERRLVLSDHELGSESALERCTVSWSAFANFMENRWAFFLWDARRTTWHMIPKRAFASAAELDRCRALLSRRLRRSPWFNL